MTAKDRYIIVEKTGVITMCVENDGWSYMSGGAERQESEVSLASLRDTRFLDEAIGSLEGHGFVVDRKALTFKMKS